MNTDIYQGDILKIENISNPVLVVSKDFLTVPVRSSAAR